jgi:hypothetical protein
MKYIFILLLVPLICGTGCQSSTPQFDDDVEVVVDKTDTPRVYLSSSDILNALHFTDDPYKGVRVQIDQISDKDINATAVVSIDKENALLGTLPLRTAKITAFAARLHHALTNMQRPETAAHSIVYRTIAAQLNRLAATESTHKIMLIASDLYENSIVSFYDPNTIALLKANPHCIETALEQETPLTRLTGIQVWLLYNPASYRDNNTYMTVATFYKHLLESHGAHVHIANTFIMP